MQRETQKTHHPNTGESDPDFKSKLSPEAQEAARRVQTGKEIQRAFAEYEAEKPRFEKAVRDSLSTLAGLVREDAFDKIHAETAALLKLYEKRCDPDNPKDQATLETFSNYLDRLTADRERQKRMRQAS